MFSDKDKFTDLLIRIGAYRDDWQSHPVEASVDGDSFYYGGRLALDQQALLSRQLDNRQYGNTLQQALFSEPIKRAYERACGKASASGARRLRIRLQIDRAATALHAIRWERLYHRVLNREVPLAVTAGTPFSRFTGLERAAAKPLTERPVKMFIALANPGNLPPGLQPVAIDAEVKNLLAALGGLRRDNQLQITIQPGRTGLEPALKQQLLAGGYRILDAACSLESILPVLLQHHIFHFIGHGFYRENRHPGTANAALYLENPDGTMQIVKDDDFLRKLTAAAPAALPHLMFLSACESASPMHPALGLAARLVDAGVPAVVAMQDRVAMKLASDLIGFFYAALLRHGIIDQALNEARLLLFDDKNTDWSIPVLFMRLHDGCLFAPNAQYSVLQAGIGQHEQSLSATRPLLALQVAHSSAGGDPRFLEQLQDNARPGLEITAAIGQIFAADRRTKNGFALLLGSEGTGRTTQLRQIALAAARQSLTKKDTHGRLLIPLYADLADYFQTRTEFADRLVSFFYDQLKTLWPALEPGRFSAWLNDDSGPVFLFLLDGSDDLPAQQRLAIWERIGEFAGKHRRHCYLLACEPHRHSFAPLPVSDFLVLKSLAPAQVSAYLKSLPEQAGRTLLSALEQYRLFDLASLPWLFIQMLEQTRSGLAPRSRYSVLKRLVDERLDKILPAKGMQARAADTLYALAWECQSTRQKILPIERALGVMQTPRGKREYDLEDLLLELIDKHLLVRIGQDSIRFAYPAIQAYCCAKAILARPQAQRDIILDDITATFGRHTRLKWWQDTLVLLCGMLDEVDALLQQIIYGSRFSESEQIFLAARCIQESGRKKIEPGLLEQIADSLIWRSRADNENRAPARIRALQALGQLQIEKALPHLIELVAEKTRSNWQGKPAFEYSSVRNAALATLRQMKSPARKYVHTHYPGLDNVIDCWFSEDDKKLGAYLHNGETETLTRTVSAFALGNIGSPGAAKLLTQAFQRPDTPADLRWSLADTLTRLDPVLVTQQAILPFIDRSAAEAAGLPAQSWKKRNAWYERVAYLIGVIKPSEQSAHDFLQHCIYHYRSVWLKARAIQAIGLLGGQRYKTLFERIATGDFAEINLNPELKAGDAAYLRCVAIDALAGIGDRKTLAFLRRNMTRWSPDLEAAYFRTSEEIYWRLAKF